MDFVAIMEVDIAVALRRVDHAAMLAVGLQGEAAHSERFDEAARRVKAIRAAILDSGIQLPPLRDLSGEFTLGQIARWARLDRHAVVRRLRHLGGALLGRYVTARKAGVPALFTLAEAGIIVGIEDPGTGT